MYDKDTIISAFDKRGTLVQWLKNFDDTLKNSTLDRIEKVETNGGFAFKFVFANGVELLTPVISQAEKIEIEGGAQYDSFKITLTLSDGTKISSDDFKAPVHISEINVTEIKTISQSVDGFTVETRMFTDINGRTTINDILVYQVPIKGSDSVVVDVDESGKSIEIHLDADILNDLARMLKTPVSAPTSTELVAVDNTGAQTMLAVGDGLSVEDGTLKSKGGIKFKKITINELKEYLTQENSGKLVKLVGKGAVGGGYSFITPIINDNIPYVLNSKISILSESGKNLIFNYIKVTQNLSQLYKITFSITDGTPSLEFENQSQNFIDSFFEFYIEE